MPARVSIFLFFLFLSNSIFAEAEGDPLNRNNIVAFEVVSGDGQHTLTIISQAIKVYKSFDLQAARRLKILYKSFRKEYFEMEQQHYDRLKENIKFTHSSSKTHLEIITLLRVVSSHATNTSRILLYKNHPKKDTQ